MKRHVWIVCSLMVISSALFADTLYLKNGQVLKTQIASEDENGIFVENGNTWKRIDKAEIILRKKDTSADDAQGTANRSKVSPADDELTVSFGFSVNGIQEATTSDTPPATFSKDSVNPGVSLSGEWARYPSSMLGLGLGFSLDMPRKQESIPGDFSYYNVYGLLKLRAFIHEKSRNYMYSVFKLGYGYLSTENDFTPETKSVKGGLFYGAGAGVNLNKFNIELLYSFNRGKASFGPVAENADLVYSRFMMMFGYTF